MQSAFQRPLAGQTLKLNAFDRLTGPAHQTLASVNIPLASPGGCLLPIPEG